MTNIDMSVHQLLPPTPSPEIPRDPSVRRIVEDFDLECQVQMVVGGAQTGKTNLLAQFVREYPERCASYFTTASPLTQSQYAFLHSMCYQLSGLLKTNPPPDNMSLEGLKRLFATLCLNLARDAKLKGTRYYFVIDGLDRTLDGLKGERIIDLFPLQTSPHSPYLLVSCRSSRVNELPECMKCPSKKRPASFNRWDTMTYLTELDLSPKEVRRIHERYRGIPGYLKIIKDTKLANSDFDLETAPRELDLLIDQQVQLVLETSNDAAVNGLEVLAASPASLPLRVLADFVDAEPSELAELLQRTDLVEYNTQSHQIDYSNELVRKNIRKRMQGRLSRMVEDLLSHVQQNCPHEQFLLTLLFKEAQDYKGLRDTLTGSAIVSTIDTTGDISSVMKRLRLASEMARQNDEVDDLIRWTLGLAAAKSFVSHALSSDEIEALLSIGASRDALSRAYAIPETSVRIRLLAKAYASMKERGERVRRSSLDELEGMVQDLDVESLDKEVTQKIAIDLLPVLPDVAFSLLEKVIGKGEERSVVEAAIGALETRLEEDQREGGLSLSNKDAEGFGYIAGLLSSWLNDLSLSKLLEELKPVESTKAREYMLRQWSRQNAESAEIVKAVDLWLDTVVKDLDFVIPLRSLRHMSEVLLDIPLTDRGRLVERLRIPDFAAVDSPKQEWVRFHLSLSEALLDIDQNDARSEIEKVHRSILQGSLDADVETFCLAQVWATVRKGFPDDIEWISRISGQFEAVWRPLLDNSAEQLECVLDTIRTLIDVNPVYALTAALELNTHSRRKRAVTAVLETTLRKRGKQDIADFIEQALQPLGKRERAVAIERITARLKGRGTVLAASNLDTLLEYSKIITDPASKARTLSNIASLFSDASAKSALKVMQLAVEAWRDEEDLRIRLSLGFSMVEKAAQLDLDTARELCEEVRKLKMQPGSALAIGELGPGFRETIDLALRAITIKDLSEPDKTIRSLESLIVRIPSRVVRGQLFATLAASAYRIGYDECAKELVRTKVIRSVRETPSNLDRDIILEFSLPVIFEYDASTAKDLSRRMPYPERDGAWHSVVLWSLCRCFLGDHHLEPEDIRVARDYPRLRRAVDAAEEINLDMLVCKSIRAIANSVRESFGSKIDLTQALDILQKLDVLASSKLPEKNLNIRHEGYLTLAQAYIHGAKSSLYHRARNKRGLSKVSIGQRWEKILTSARSIPNLADRVFVMALVAPEMINYYGKNSNDAKKLLQDADSLVNDIPTLTDRVARLETIAKSWGLLGDKTEAEVVVDKAAELARQLRGARTDDRLAMLVQVAYQIDTELADDLISRLDSRLPRMTTRPATMAWEVERLRSIPTRIHELREAPMSGSVLGKTARKLLHDFAANRGSIPHTTILENWLVDAGLHSPRVTVDVAHWVVESLRRKKAELSGSQLQVFLDTAVFINRLARWLSTEREDGIPEAVHDSFPGLSGRIVSFGAGEVERAQAWLQRWLAENAEDYLKICDPYFGKAELEYLAYVRLDCKVLIVTTDSKFSLGPHREMKEHLERCWRRISSRALPRVQLLLIPKRLEDNLHDRAIITSHAGLDIGQSLNGLGKKRGKITVLSEEDAKELERAYVDPMLNNATWFMKEVTPTVLVLGD